MNVSAPLCALLLALPPVSQATAQGAPAGASQASTELLTRLFARGLPARAVQSGAMVREIQRRDLGRGLVMVVYASRTMEPAPPLVVARLSDSVYRLGGFGEAAARQLSAALVKRGWTIHEQVTVLPVLLDPNGASDVRFVSGAVDRSPAAEGRAESRTPLDSTWTSESGSVVRISVQTTDSWTNGHASKAALTYAFAFSAAGILVAWWCTRPVEAP